MAQSASQAIAHWCNGAAIDSLPEAGWSLARQALLDTLGVSLLGSRLDAPRIVARTEFVRGSIGTASVYGMGRKSDVLGAALINGTSAHADLFDDNSAPMIAHPSSPLVSSLLALAQDRGLGGAAVLQAYAVGFEVGVRLGRRLNPALYERGWHATRVLGLIGSTAACCRLLRLGPERSAAAVGIAVSMASGARQNFGSMTMALHVGLTARDAVHCALLAEAGMQSDSQSMEGKYGFFHLFAGGQPGPLEFGNPFELLESGIIFKPYPSGAPTHAAIDAALALRDRLGDELSGITAVECRVHPWNAMTLRDEEPRDQLQAKVSLRYCVAAALLHGELTFRQFTDQALTDPALQSLMKMVSVSTDAGLPDNGEFPAAVQVRTAGGRLMIERRDVPPGGSTRPLSGADVYAKFRSCSQLCLEPRSADRVVEMVLGFEQLEDLRDFSEMLEACPPSREPGAATG